MIKPCMNYSFCQSQYCEKCRFEIHTIKFQKVIVIIKRKGINEFPENLEKMLIEAIGNI